MFDNFNGGGDSNREPTPKERQETNRKIVGVISQLVSVASTDFLLAGVSCKMLGLNEEAESFLEIMKRLTEIYESFRTKMDVMYADLSEETATLKHHEGTLRISTNENTPDSDPSDLN